MKLLLSLILLTCYGVLLGQSQSSEIALIKQEIRNQQAAIEAQNRNLNALMERLESLERETAKQPVTAPQGRPRSQSQTPAGRAASPAITRDSVGDLNAGRIQAGDFPGSILLPGRDVSLGIGGFVKTEIFHDSKAEGREAIFLPALLGAGRDDRDGTTSLTAELSRMYIDGRATIGNSKMRGYIEFDFSGGGDQLKLRHAYMTWDNAKWGQLLAGKYWSNFMDIQALPEGLTEPTLSGGVFTRQSQFRYTRPLAGTLRFSASLEDAASSDITAPGPVNTRTAWPDSTASLTWNGEHSHFRAGGLVRRITVDPDNQNDFGATSWGFHASGHIDLGPRDKFTASLAYGNGLGRYLLGILPTGAAFVDPDARAIHARKNLGVVVGVRHQWNRSCRSTIATGYAATPVTALQPDGDLRASIYGMANYMCSVSRYVTVGGEYDYGRRWNKVGSVDNHRVMFGFQIF